MQIAPGTIDSFLLLLGWLLLVLWVMGMFWGMISLIGAWFQGGSSHSATCPECGAPVPQALREDDTAGGFAAPAKREAVNES